MAITNNDDRKNFNNDDSYCIFQSMESIAVESIPPAVALFIHGPVSKALLSQQRASLPFTAADLLYAIRFRLYLLHNSKHQSQDYFEFLSLHACAISMQSLQSQRAKVGSKPRRSPSMQTTIHRPLRSSPRPRLTTGSWVASLSRGWQQ